MEEINVKMILPPYKLQIEPGEVIVTMETGVLFKTVSVLTTLTYIE